MSGTIRNVIIGVVIALAAVGIWYLVKPNGSPVPSDRRFVNVLTGETRAIPKNKIISIPEVDSQGRKVLYPFIQRDDGIRIIEERFQERLRNDLSAGVLNPQDLAIDPATFQLR